MSWVSPLLQIKHKEERVICKGKTIVRVAPGTPPRIERRVEVNGVIYPTLTAAARALECSTTKIYRMMR